MKNIRRLEQILEEVKQKFPMAKKKRIKIKLRNLKYDYMNLEQKGREYIFNIDEKTIVPVKNRQILRGIFAHELAHIENDSTLRGAAINWDIRSDKDSSVYRGYVESCADMTAIVHGFGRELYLVKVNRRVGKEHKRYKREEGLTIAQTKKLVFNRN